jgi:hypothetical protein
LASLYERPADARSAPFSSGAPTFDNALANANFSRQD